MRVTIGQIKEMKQKGEKIPMLTAYDYATARLIDEVGVPLILVGLYNAGRFLQEGGAQAVKVEGGESMAEAVHRVVECGIPVMGHIGLTPQSMHQLGGFKVQGKSPEAAIRLIKDAQALEEAGVFSIVLESIPTPVAKIITQKVGVPTIGIGAGPWCDGQVQVISDLLGLFTDFVPKHAKQYAKLFDTIKKATADYISEVQNGTFPTEKESHAMDESLLAGLEQEV